MNFSIYTSAFNLDLGVFNIEGAIKNWSQFASEIVIATLPKDKDKIFDLIPPVPPCIIRVIGTTLLTTNDPEFDGKLKDVALQACLNEYVIQQDLDERILAESKELEDAVKYIKQYHVKAIMLPVLDLYKDFTHYKSMGQKWYIHKKEGTKRGVVNFARRPNGTVDTNKSDGCELIDLEGNLVPSLQATSLFASPPTVIHYGYLNLKNRAKLNKEFWSEQWSKLNGSKVEIKTDVEGLESMECKELPLNFPDLEALYNGLPSASGKPNPLR